VAILSAIPKRSELLVFRTMYDDLKNLISVNQHGLMKNRSTVTNLLEYTYFVLNSIKEGWQVDLVYTDLYHQNCQLDKKSVEKRKMNKSYTT
jgi:hypothetical protein